MFRHNRLVSKGGDNTRGVRGHSRKLVKFRCTQDWCIFSNRVINRWNQLDQRVVDAPASMLFKRWLNKARETRMGFFNGLFRRALGLPGGFSGW